MAGDCGTSVAVLVLAVFLAAASGATFVPGDKLPAFNVSTLPSCADETEGACSEEAAATHWEWAPERGMSVVVWRFKPGYLFHEAMWHPASLEEFLLNGPSQAVHYLVCMEEADGEITPVLGALRDALQAAVDALGRSDFEHRLGQMHFATQACSGISEAMSAIVAEWPPLFRANRQIEVSQGRNRFKVSRLDCQAFWCNPFIPDGVYGRITGLDNGQELCDGTSTAWKDQWLLVPHANASTACNYGKLLDNAKANSALGVIVYAQEGTVPAEMGSLPSDGWPPQNVHGTMISYADGVKLASLTANGQVRARFTTDTDEGAGHLLGATASGVLVEAGFAMFARLSSVHWLGSNLAHMSAQLERLAPMAPAVETRVFESAALANRATVHLDASTGMPERPSAFNVVELALGLFPTAGPWESDAPPWDRLLQMHVCCDDDGSGTLPPCAATCRTTWRRSLRGDGDEACGFELGRWVTPYKRSGSWVSDISPLLPLFSSPSCRFTIAVGGETGWSVNATLRWFTGYDAVVAQGMAAGVAAAALPPQLHAHDVARRSALAGAASDAYPAEPSGLRHGHVHAARGAPLAAPRCMPHIVNAAFGNHGRGDQVTRTHASTREHCEPDENPAAFFTPRPAPALPARGLRAAATAATTADGSSIATGDRWWRSSAELQNDPYPTTVPEFLAAESEALGGLPLHPYKVVPLWPGGTFNTQYNGKQGAVQVPTPDGYRALKTHAAALVATITGHGVDSSACGEFCPVSHHFSMNGWGEKVASYPSAGAMWGCASGENGFDGTPFGQVPNQYGTWFYGRHGWCPGQHVPPLVWDVSYDMALPGEENELTYQAKLYGAPYDKDGGGAEIVFTAYLVLYTTDPLE